MTKSRWIEIIEWLVLVAVALFTAGVFLTDADDEISSSVAPRTYLDE